jgi:hypothetical protein
LESPNFEKPLKIKIKTIMQRIIPKKDFTSFPTELNNQENNPI